MGGSPLGDLRHRHRKIVLNFGPVIRANGTILEILNSKAVTVVAKCLLTDAEDPGSIPGDHSNLLPLSATLSLDFWHFLLAYLYLPARLAKLITHKSTSFQFFSLSLWVSYAKLTLGISQFYLHL